MDDFSIFYKQRQGYTLQVLLDQMSVKFFYQNWSNLPVHSLLLIILFYIISIFSEMITLCWFLADFFYLTRQGRWRQLSWNDLQKSKVFICSLAFFRMKLITWIRIQFVIYLLNRWWWMHCVNLLRNFRNIYGWK